MLNYSKPILSTVLQRVRSLIVSNTQNSTSSADSSSYTFTSCSLGSEDPGRWILVGVAENSDFGGYTVSSLTVDGLSAFRIGQVTNHTAGNNGTAEFWLAFVPYKTTGDIIVTWSGTARRCMMSVWSLIGLRFNYPLATASSTATTTATLDVNCVDGGAVFGIAIGNNSSTATWTGGTERVDGVTETVCFTSADASSLTSQAPRTFNVVRSVASDSGPCVALAVAMR